MRNLPARLVRMIGRDAAVYTIVQQLRDYRFVTIVGPGGIGKTTVALAVAHALQPDFGGWVRLVDLSVVSDPNLVATAVAFALDAPAHSDPISSAINLLKGKSVLLILDNCEHVIEAVSVMVERIFSEAPEVSLLVTSREHLNVEGERIYRLSPLDYPLSDVGLTSRTALSFSSIALFVERVAASSTDFELDNADAAAVSGICRKLDGIALAIELAAGRVAAYGINEVATLLDSRLKMLWHGRRTAPARHQTLNATLDWSYELLTELEREVLRKFSVFVGPFSLEAARAVAGNGATYETQILEAVASLVAKSLLAPDVGGPSPRYRLLEMTRAYMREKLVESGEIQATTLRHAIYYRDLLEQEIAASDQLIKPDRIAFYADQVGNVRAALEACFSPEGNLPLGVELAACSHSLFLTMSLWDECQAWCERALSALNETTRGTRLEMLLQSSLAMSHQARWRGIDLSHAAFIRSLGIAETLDDKAHQLFVLAELRSVRFIYGDAPGALDLASRSKALATAIGDATQAWVADCALGQAHHVIGNQSAAQGYCESALAQTTAVSKETLRHFEDDTIYQTRCVLAATLWLRGFPNQAAAFAKQTVADAEASGDFLLLANAIMWVTRVFTWSGDWQAKTYLIEKLAEIGRLHSLSAYEEISASLKGEMLIDTGDVEQGVRKLQQRMMTTPGTGFQVQEITALASGLATLGNMRDALSTIDRAIAVESRFGETYALPEMLRRKGGILGATPGADPTAAEDCLSRAGDMARRQSALSWELRIATSLAMLRGQQGRPAEGREILAPVYERFTEGFETPDLVRARRLLGELV
jgi:predicted ATPase